MNKEQELNLLASRLPYAKYNSSTECDGFLLEFQIKVGEWSAKTFPQSIDGSRIAHMFDELQELQEKPNDAYEMADIFLLLLHHAHVHGIDLEQAARIKFDILQRREWGEPDARGVVKHIVIK